MNYTIISYQLIAFHVHFESKWSSLSGSLFYKLKAIEGEEFEVLGAKNQCWKTLWPSQNLENYRTGSGIADFCKLHVLSFGCWNFDF